MDLSDWIKEQTPDESLETMDAAEDLTEALLLSHGLHIPEEDKKKYVMISDKLVFYPPKEYEGKRLTAVAFIDLLRKHKLVPITVGNIKIFMGWKEAREMFGYSVLFKHLMDTYHIIPTMED